MSCQFPGPFVLSVNTYLAKIAAVVANTLGISGLVAQFVHVLKAVASAMEQALKALVVFVVTLTRALLAEASSPIVSSLRAGVASQLASLGAASTRGSKVYHTGSRLGKA